MQSDAELLEAWRGGDRRAGSRLFERHFESLYRFFNHKVGDRDVSDLMQQTFLAVVEGRDRFRSNASVRTYLFAIARKKLIDYWRARTKHDRLDFTTSSLGQLDPSPSSILRRKRSEQVLLTALRSIPVDLQIVVELSYWEDLSGPELAEVLEVPEGTVRSRLRRAKELLRDALAAAGMTDGAVPTTPEELDRWARDLKDGLGRGV